MFKKYIYIFILLGYSFSSYASSIPKDKIQHFALSSLIGFASNNYFENHETALISCLAVGLSKEFYDEISYSGFSGGDMVANILGCGFGAVSSEYLGFELGYKEQKDVKMLTFNVRF